MLNEAKNAVAANDSLPGEVTDLYNRLSQAISKLEPATNRSGLKTALDVAKAILDNSSSYIPASIAGLQAAYDKANAAYNQADATQDEVDKAQKELMAEALKARKPANKELLKQGLGRAANMQGLSQAAIEAAQTLLDAPDAAQADVDAAYNKLRDAMDNARNIPVVAKTTISEGPTPTAAPVVQDMAEAAAAESDPYMTPAQPADDASGQALVLPEMQQEQLVSVEQEMDNIVSGMWTVALVAMAGLCLLLALALLAKRYKNHRDK